MSLNKLTQIIKRKTSNDFALLTACTDCTALCTPHQPPEVQVFALWYLAVESPEESTDATPEDVNAARIIQQQIDATYPGLRTVARAEKSALVEGGFKTLAGSCSVPNLSREMLR
jgi:hypothetical protein